MESLPTAPSGVRVLAACLIHSVLIFTGRKLDSVGLTQKVGAKEINDLASFPLDSDSLLQAFRQVFLASPGRVQHDEPLAGWQISASSNE